LAFGAGFLLGPIRVLWLAPQVGDRTAELIEAPIMLLVILATARWIVSQKSLNHHRSRLLVGVTASALVLVADLAVGVFLRELTPSQVFLDRDPLAGAVYHALIILLALAPWAMGICGLSRKTE
jgi:hypothetical protein